MLQSNEFDADMAALVERGWLKSMRDDGAAAAASPAGRAACEDESMQSEAAALYSFRFAVAVNVAYNRLPFSIRGSLHRCIGDWYEELYAVQPCPQYLPKLAFHWQQAAAHIADSSSASAGTPASGGPGSGSSPSSSSLSASPHTPGTPQSNELEDSPDRLSVAVVRHDGGEQASGAAAAVPQLHSASVTPLPSQSARQSLSSTPSTSAVNHCRQRAIHWLREAGEAAVKQGARREAVTWIGKAMELIDLLPDRGSLRWRRELLLLLAVYCPTHSVLVGMINALPDWSRLCSLCEEVQQKTEEQRKRRQLSLQDDERTPEEADAEDGHRRQRGRGGRLSRGGSLDLLRAARLLPRSEQQLDSVGGP